MIISPMSIRPHPPDPRRRRRSAFAVVIAGMVLSGLTSPSPSASEDAAGEAFLRGMTVSCPGYGRIWGSRSMADSLQELSEIGVRWVAIHPYAGVRRDGTVRFQSAGETGYLDRAVTLARESGIELFWKPHLAYWGSFEWRGAIRFGDDEAAWRRFFDGYHAFIVDQARFAESSDIQLLSIGLEYEATTGREVEWRRIIAAVRAVYSGRIVYAANWDRLDSVPFWDAVDLIGVQAYFPLSYDEDPGSEALWLGWDGPVEKLRRLSKQHGKPVLFAEIGYDFSPDAARAPWRSARRETPESRALRRRLMEVALQRIEGESFIQGMFWWKWIPGTWDRDDFSMRHAEAREILRRAWGEGAGGGDIETGEARR